MQASLSETLRIFRREAPVSVLGPYARAVVWVQGCPFHCTNCIVPESWDAEQGDVVSIDDLAGWVCRQPGIEGLTLSGGEPMMQAEALGSLIDSVRSRADFGVVCYTGFHYETLLSRGSEPQRSLLERIDLLIDGVYREDQHEDLLWRGSRNQRLLSLTSRYAKLIETMLAERGDRSAGMEVVMDADSGIGYAGVPARPGFRDDFIKKMRARGIRLSIGVESPIVKEAEASLRVADTNTRMSP